MPWSTWLQHEIRPARPMRETLSQVKQNAAASVVAFCPASNALVTPLGFQVAKSGGNHPHSAIPLAGSAL
ncbi:hypothetical protein EVAR_89699_1 [Eumeta japonica]|uniref:Uncharacterized protein n=1 Tax=Eumeta variegata TaxID=151549 RepID=A0A4C1X0J8_EUMVA|nr:hypothetical protein EVAR_89699_1 [Eumeta japonica]